MYTLDNLEKTRIIQCNIIKEERGLYSISLSKSDDQQCQRSKLKYNTISIRFKKILTYTKQNKLTKQTYIKQIYYKKKQIL